jgi:tRNA-specific 2-thiouridylase
MLGQEQLGRLLLPVGGLAKEQVREVAAGLGLDTATKPESMEICFVPGNDYRAFVADRVAARPGAIVDETGRTVGEHAGVTGFTVGQRKGLGVALGEPRFVTGIDAQRNIVTIGPEEALFSSTVTFSAPRWVSGEAPAVGAMVLAKTRYRAEPAPATLVAASQDQATVRFERRQRAVTPGQAICLYDGDEVLGGGTIEGAV